MRPTVAGRRRRAAPALDPPDRGALWLDLALTQAQLIELCGVSRRQVEHWIARGYLTPRPDRDRYNGNAVELCLLIKQGLDAGLSLRRAVAQARAFLAEEEACHPSLAQLDPEVLPEIAERLRGARAALAAVREVVEPRVPPGDVGDP